MAMRVCITVIPSVDEELRALGMFAFVASHLFSAGGSHSSAVNDPLCLV